MYRVNETIKQARKEGEAGEKMIMMSEALSYF